MTSNACSVKDSRSDVRRSANSHDTCFSSANSALGARSANSHGTHEDTCFSSANSNVRCSSLLLHVARRFCHEIFVSNACREKIRAP